MKTFHLRNPVMIAAGTFGSDGYGKDAPNLNYGSLGAVVLKTTTMRPREGNSGTHLFRALDGLAYINNVGLKNPGIDAVLEQDWPYDNLVLSIAGADTTEIGKLAQLVAESKKFRAIELNLGCPNTRGEILSANSAMEVRPSVFRACESGLSVFVKVSPIVPDIKSLALAVEEAGANALTLCNTAPGAYFEIDDDKTVMQGGLSGKLIKYINLNLVYQAKRALYIPIIGCGGIRRWQDAAEYFAAGAEAVQVGTAQMEDPFTPFRVAHHLDNWLRRQTEQ